MKSLMLLALILSLSPACASAPPKLSPTATQAFQKTRLIKVLDLLRDTAIDGNAQMPPLFSTPTTKKIVTVHQTALKVIQATDTGWANAVGVALAQLSHDPSLLPTEVQLLAPYFALAADILKGLS
jgi:hypothetical protein